jgi:8-oxo-dGTP diphosphatase
MTEPYLGKPRPAEALPPQEIFKVTPIVYIILTRIIEDRKQIYLQLKKSTRLWTLPGGHLEDGEASKIATIRETTEETGVEIDKNDLRLKYIAHIKDSIGQRICYFHETTIWDEEPYNKEPEKCDSVGWFDIETLPEEMNPYTRQCLREIEALTDGTIGYGEYGFHSQPS